MKRILLPVAVALLGAMTMAFAQDQMTSTIQSIDPVRHVVVLADGHAYFIRPDNDMTVLRVGEPVRVTHEMRNGRPEALIYTSNRTFPFLPLPFLMF